jgi:flavodoxin
MHIQVVYSAPSENMRRLAGVIATALKAYGTVRLASVSQLGGADLRGVDLLVVGCPTHLYGLNPAMRFWLDALPMGMVQGLPVAAFDLTCRDARLLDVPAAHSLAQRLQRAGATLIAPPESFFVADRQKGLEPGERERAIRWVQQILPALFAPLPATTVPQDVGAATASRRARAHSPGN